MKRFASISTTAALTISLLYFSFGMAWIELSDLALFSMFDDMSAEEVTQMQTYKGFFFIGITSLLLFVVVNRHLRKIHKLEEEKLQQIEELDALFNNELFGIARADLNGHIQKANTTLRTLFQVSPTGSIPSMADLSFQGQPVIEQKLWEELLNGKQSEYTHQLERSMGPGLSVHIKAVRDARFEPKYFILTVG